MLTLVLAILGCLGILLFIATLTLGIREEFQVRRGRKELVEVEKTRIVPLSISYIDYGQKRLKS